VSTALAGRSVKAMAAVILQKALPAYTDVATLSEQTAIAKSTWRQWIRDGKLRAYRAPGGQIRILVDDALALLRPV
jgi:excisionase family DNA binding protein